MLASYCYGCLLSCLNILPAAKAWEVDGSLRVFAAGNIAIMVEMGKEERSR